MKSIFIGQVRRYRHLLIVLIGLIMIFAASSKVFSEESSATVKGYGGVRFDDQNLPANLLINPGFEDEDALDDWLPDFTLNPHAEEDVLIDATVAHSGKKSLKIIGRKETACALHQTVRPVDPMRAYELWVWVKTENLQDTFYVQILCMDKDRNIVPDGNWFKQDGKNEFLSSGGTQDWQRKSLIIRKLPRKTDRVNIYLRSSCADTTGTIWIDDVGLKPLTLKESPEARPEASETGDAK